MSELFPRFTLAGITGCVQGCGGMVRHANRIEQAIRQVNRGRPSPLYEPRPGHCLMFPEFSARGNGPGFEVSLMREWLPMPDLPRQRDMFA